MRRRLALRRDGGDLPAPPGETEWNKLGKFQGLTDVSLNDRGLAQAKDSARAALGWEHGALYSSSLTRTVQVAEEIRKVTGTPIVTQPGLRELSLGDLEGVTGAEMREGWPELYASWRKNPADVQMPNGESLSQLQERAWQVIQDIERHHADESGVVVVCHNSIRPFLRILDIPGKLTIAGLGTVHLEATVAWALVTYNCNSHLSPENR